ncbi:MAG TPA: tetratricopeptide repeat protein [Dyella sp.]|uniref:tetratricopeptide repeat protein n=1 Tax=Dyella sp. TaxID=1869338 RepID=UPI002BDFE6F1|nr:tetratricopeptide repeat protein [Dyella sp.]HTV87272.1 tetratricopeptide repeat protein [Dyella sp.]
MNMISDNALNALIRVGHLATQAGLVAQSIRFFEHLRDAYPLKAFPYVGIGLACIKTGRYAQAYEAFEQARTLDGSNGDIRLWCGICHLHCGRFAKSAQIFREIIATPPATGLDGFLELAKLLLDSPQLSPFRRPIVPQHIRG